MRNEDETDDHSSPAQPEIPLTCAECGERVDPTEWHPVTTTTDDDGTFRLRAFCSQACRDAWRDRHD